MQFLKQVEAEIKKSGVDYLFKYGKRHIKIIIGGVFCGITPLDGRGGQPGRSDKNIMAQVRRQIKRTKENDKPVSPD